MPKLAIKQRTIRQIRAVCRAEQPDWRAPTSDHRGVASRPERRFVDIFEVTASDMSLDAMWVGGVPALRLADLACQAESLLVLYAADAG
jgi:hypothetical protein